MIVDLPAPTANASASLVACLGHRRSIRQYAKAAISIGDLSRLLWAAQGITGAERKTTTPSAGGLSGLGLHILVRRVAELEPGIYAHERDTHTLRLLSRYVPEAKIQALAIGEQPWLSDAAVVIGVVAKLEKATEHFAAQPPWGTRGARYVYMESGALAQNVHLYATALGLAGVLVAGFDDLQAKQVLRLGPALEPTALICIGQRPRK